VRIETGVTPIEIVGSADNGVGGVQVHTAGGAPLRIDCDAVGLGYHLRPETQIADLARCTFYFDGLTRQWLPEIDSDGRSSVPRVYLAGDGARILGADGAEAAGALAAFAVLRDLGRVVDAGAIERLRKTVATMDRFRRGLAEAFPWPAAQAAALPDEAVVCRCETITAGELRQATLVKSAQEVNRAKAFSRVGMGRCQGRYCGHAAAEIIAAATGLAVEQVGRIRGQAPVKPLTIAAAEPAE
jgi:hypothetical protein